MKYKFNFSLSVYGLTVLVMILKIMLILQQHELFIMNTEYMLWMAIAVLNLLAACVQKEKE